MRQPGGTTTVAKPGPHGSSEDSAPPIASSAPVPQHEVSLAFANAFKLGSSLALTWTIAILVRFLLPRQLGPERFGELSFAEAFAAGLFALLDLGISTYAMREVAVRPRHASDFFGGVLALRGALALTLFAVMAGVLFARGKSLELQLAAAGFGAAFALESVSGTLATFLRATGDVTRLAAVQVIGKLIWAALLVVALFGGGVRLGLVFLVLPVVVSDLFKVVALYPATARALDLRLTVDRAATRTALVASFPFFVNLLALSLGGRLNVWVVEAVATPSEVGWYAAAVNLSTLAMLFTPLFSWVLLPLLSRARSRSQDELFWIARRCLEGFALAATPVALVIGYGADDWVRLALGLEYAPAAAAVRMMAVTVTLTYVAMVLSMVLIVLDQSWSLSALSVTSVLLAPGLALVLVPWLARIAGPGGGALGAAIAATTAEGFVVVALLLRIGLRAVDRRTLATWAKVAASVLVVVAVDQAFAPGGYLRPAAVLAAYLISAVALRAVRLRDLRAAIRSLREAGPDPGAPLADDPTRIA